MIYPYLIVRYLKYKCRSKMINYKKDSTGFGTGPNDMHYGLYNHVQFLFIRDNKKKKNNIFFTLSIAYLRFRVK